MNLKYVLKPCAARSSGILIALMVFSTGCGKLKQERPAIEKQDGSTQAESAELLYQTASLELSLATSEKPYLVIDMTQRALEIRLKGAILLTIPLKILASEKGDLDKFITSFGSEGTLLRPIAGKYLFESVDQTPDSVLKIVSEVVNVKPELLQREIPERFRLFWSNKLILDVVSEKDSTEVPKSRPKETLQETLQGKLNDIGIETGYVMRKPFGARLIVVEANPEDALTLFRVSNEGVPTLLQLISTETALPVSKSKKKK